jgi:hypothetical protein
VSRAMSPVPKRLASELSWSAQAAISSCKDGGAMLQFFTINGVREPSATVVNQQQIMRVKIGLE